MGCDIAYRRLHISSRFEVLKRLERICAICGSTWGSRLRYGWTGREYDAETGLYFHRARSYSPVQRRFIQEDPLAGNTSPYAYVTGSPLEATDPSGMVPDWGGSTGAGRQWARAQLDFGCSDSPWNGPGCGSDWDGWFEISGTLLPILFTHVMYEGKEIGRLPGLPPIFFSTLDIVSSAH